MTEKPSRRSLLAAASAVAAGLVAGTARADDPPVERPTVPPDPSKVLGGGATPTSLRSPFETPAIAPAGGVTGPAFAPVQTYVGTITPTDLQFQRHHAGIAQIDPLAWRLLIHGLVERPITLTLADLKRFPSVTRVHFLECSGNGRNGYRDRGAKPDMTVQQMDGLIANLEWTGVPLATVLAEVGVKPEATWFLAEGGDGSLLTRSIPVEKAFDDAMLVYAANGEPLRPAHGYPVRLLLPGFEANTNVKWLRRLEFVTAPLMGRDETSRYTDPLPDHKARQFSFVMDAKSILTSPTYPEVLTPGWWNLSGLAWSGRGKIARVDVSTDGGKTWTEAHLTPATAKAAVRFTLPWRWEGQETVILTRATDETGYTQPTAEEFRRIRGPGTDLHFNMIRGWRVGADGHVTYDVESA